MLNSLGNSIESVLEFSLPMVILSVIIAVSLRIADIIKNKRKIVLYKEVLALFFMIYILCLFQVVTFQDTTYVTNNNFIPFKEIFRYSIGSRLFIKNVIGNVVMFIPYGFFCSYILKEDKYQPILVLTLIASISIETTQLMIGRVFDIDDIILNSIGGMLGFYAYVLLLKIREFYKPLFSKEWMLNIIAILLLIGFVRIIL